MLPGGAPIRCITSSLPFLLVVVCIFPTYLAGAAWAPSDAENAAKEVLTEFSVEFGEQVTQLSVIPACLLLAWPIKLAAGSQPSCIPCHLLPLHAAC
jgi:hypothetical protein